MNNVPWKEKLLVSFGAILGIGGLLFVLRHFEWDRFLNVLSSANKLPLLLILLSIILEQVFRAIKWGQILFPLQKISTLRTFGAIMVGYLSNLIIPVRVSPLVRAWVISHLEKLKLSTILATIALDRIIDGFIFVTISLITIFLVSVPLQGQTIERGIFWGSIGTSILFILILLLLVDLHDSLKRKNKIPKWVSIFIFNKWKDTIFSFITSFGHGIVFPKENWRRCSIIILSILMKLLAASQLAFAGMAFGVELDPIKYIFIMVFLGFLVILAGTIRLVGGYTTGTIFVLGAFGVDSETALSMGLIVQIMNMVTVVGTGILTLFIYGISFEELRNKGKALAKKTNSNN